MAAKQAMKENLQCTSKYGHLRISQDICHVRMTDIEGFLTIYGHSDNLLNNNIRYPARPRRIIVKYSLQATGSFTPYLSTFFLILLKISLILLYLHSMFKQGPVSVQNPDYAKS